MNEMLIKDQVELKQKNKQLMKKIDFYKELLLSIEDIVEENIEPDQIKNNLSMILKEFKWKTVKNYFNMMIIFNAIDVWFI